MLGKYCLLLGLSGLAFLYIPSAVFSSNPEDLLLDKNFLQPNVILDTRADEEPPTVYNLKRWIVEEKVDPIGEELLVYKSKFGAKYNRRIWVTDRSEGVKRLVAKFTTTNARSKILFSPDEEFMYYFGVTPIGENIVFGVNLLTSTQFPLGEAWDFNTVSCGDNKNYLVVREGEESKVYRVYTTSGESFKTLMNIEGEGTVEKSLCQAK